jgi:hypothetical protein
VGLRPGVEIAVPYPQLSCLRRTDYAHMVTTDALGHTWLLSRIYAPSIAWLRRLGRIFRGRFPIVSDDCLCLHSRIYGHAAKLSFADGDSKCARRSPLVNELPTRLTKTVQLGKIEDRRGVSLIFLCDGRSPIKTTVPAYCVGPAPSVKARETPVAAEFEVFLLPSRWS